MTSRSALGPLWSDFARIVAAAERRANQEGTEPTGGADNKIAAALAPAAIKEARHDRRSPRV
jgi:hypothetical protein